jgi:tRNA(Ile)-lysidine synthase
LLDDLARSDLLHCAGSPAGTLGLRDSLAIPALAALSADRQANLLRFWLASADLPAPASRALSALLARLAGAGPWRVQFAGGYGFCRYRDWLFLERGTLPTEPPPSRPWNLASPLRFAALGVCLEARPVGTGWGLDPARASDVRVGWRRGGERLRPAGRGGSCSLKKFRQERGIPPWERPLMPLLWVGGEIAAVPGHAVCEPFAIAGKGLEVSMRIEREAPL